MLTRGLQRTADKIIKSRTENQTETTGEHGSPPGISDDSVVDDQGSASVRRSKRTTKNQGPKRLGSPVKHSVKYNSADEDADTKMQSDWRMSKTIQKHPERANLLLQQQLEKHGTDY